MKAQKKAFLFAIIAVLFWSTVGSAFKLTLKHINYLQMLLFASFVSIIALLIVIFIQKKIVLIKNIKTKDIKNSALLGFLNPFLFYIFLFKGYSLLLTQEAVVLNFTWPITMVLLSIPLLKQKVNIKSILAIIISFAGAIIIATKGNVLQMKFSNITGVIIMLSSTVFWALYWILNVKGSREDLIKLFFNFIFGFIYILILNIVLSNINFPDIYGLIGVIYIGLFEMSITYIFWLKALRYSSTTAKVSNLIFIAPFFSLIVISFVVGEKIMLSTIIGLVLIILGIAIQQRK